MSTLKDDNGVILPLTINTALIAPSTAFSRTAISGDSRTTALNLSFVSRPSAKVNVNVSTGISTSTTGRMSSSPR